MILRRIQPIISATLPKNQIGFIPGKSTTNQILALRRLIEEVKSKNMNAIITYVDFRKALDSIDRVRMFKITKVLIPDGETNSFYINSGVLQGDTLAPFLFIIVFKYGMRSAIQCREEELGFELESKKSRSYPATILTDLSYAADIALVSHAVYQAQTLLTCVEEEAKIGLHINAKKTEIISYNQIQPILHTKCKTVLKVVDNFKYLGTWMASSLRDFEVIKEIAWKACHKLKQILKSTLNRKIKIRIFRATIEIILLYGSETWTITKTFENKIDGCYTRLIRIILNISWRDKISNKILYIGLPKISEVIRDRRMTIAGHCVRHNDEACHDLIFWQPRNGNKKQRPATYNIYR